MSLSISKTKFYVPLPLGNDWNRPYPPFVIETVAVLTKPNTTLVHLKVLAPDSFAKKWPLVCRLVFVECEGPARKLGEDEYLRLLNSLKSKASLSKEDKSATTIPDLLACQTVNDRIQK